MPPANHDQARDDGKMAQHREGAHHPEGKRPLRQLHGDARLADLRSGGDNPLSRGRAIAVRRPEGNGDQTDK
jgi:hypothetical protein